MKSISSSHCIHSINSTTARIPQTKNCELTFPSSTVSIYGREIELWISNVLSKCPFEDDFGLSQSLFNPNNRSLNSSSKKATSLSTLNETGVQSIGFHEETKNVSRNQSNALEALIATEDHDERPVDQSLIVAMAEAKPISRSEVLKNFLPCLKRRIIKLRGNDLRQIDEEVVVRFLQNEKKSNKIEFANLFQSNKARAILAEIFRSGVLKRELQLSVMSPASRTIYLNELTLMKKAVLTKRIPNL